MSASFPIALSSVLALAAALGGLAVVAYILKMRRRRFEVPFSALWHRVLAEKDSQSLFKKLKRLLSLLLQLVILALLLFAVIDPRLGEDEREARSVVIILDASASMKATDERDGGPSVFAEPAGDGDASDDDSAGGDGNSGGADSVQADDDGPPRTRMAIAKARARELLDAMGGGDAAMIIRMDGQTTPLSRFDSDMALLKRTVSGIEASDTPADLSRALSAAADALRGRAQPMIVLIGDGAYPDEVRERVIWEPLPEGADSEARLDAIDLSGIDVRFVPVGRRGDNVGIVAFNARRYLTDKTSYAVFVEVQNFGQEPAARKLVVYSGSDPIDVQTVELAAGERLRKLYPNLGGGQGNRLRAVLQPVEAGENGADIFPLDDEAFALLPARKRQEVLLVTEDNLYLEGAMLVYDSIQVDKLVPAEYEQALAEERLPAYDAVVFDDFAPSELPPAPTNLMYFGPRGEDSPFPIRRTVSGPRITEVNDSHPVMRWVVLADVNFDESAVFAVDAAAGESMLAAYVRDPLIAARREGARKIVAFGFSLTGTDLTLRVAFPLILVNALDWFAGDDADLITTYRTGQRFRVPLDGVFDVPEVEVVLPEGRRTRAPVSEGHASFYGHRIGVHQLTARAAPGPDGSDGAAGPVIAQLELAANLANPAESQVAPAPALSLGGRALPAPEGFRVSVRRSLWLYLALAALALLMLEWITYHRRITV
ncbi:VWA domain-containing protein [Haliangium ochraceum]|uniref:von Willebrand factor type A n=1 Tax=Haliangium ochraceum (strain DSM 14365 / JCM 11303 / SMP-2) TaxID=502025 RepID=D0LTR9_HALO1|nr:VWA domain-containing protein [Haliangium ochraceum]ACY15763.1 von Willebrand factor type A [Haliangium ochraceum DSM 14365]